MGFINFSNSFSSASSNFFLVIRKSYSISRTGTRSSIWGSHVSFLSVFLKSPAKFKCPTRRLTQPLSSLSILSMNALPQSINVTSSPSFETAASSLSRSMVDVYVISFLPRSAFFLCRGMLLVSGMAGPSVKWNSTRPAELIAQYLGAIGSMTRLLIVHNLSHSIRFKFLDAPCDRMNSCSPFTVNPRLMIPWTVGNRGSFQPST
mmetsp:Transcript_490/g.829  ORF Transcript_490/g.829 Transcript_490/m.829 type:complete len:205 (+) Transcript_490:676-1290(+)